MPPHAASLPVNITIHGLDPDLAAAFRDFADKAKCSLNTAAKELLRRALGLPTADEAARIAEPRRRPDAMSEFGGSSRPSAIASPRTTSGSPRTPWNSTRPS